MNTDIIEGKWTVVKGKLRERWGKLTSDDVMALEGHAEQLAGKLQQLYGLDRAAAEKEIEAFMLEQDLS